MIGKIIKFLRDEDGQTSTEYILLVAVVAMIVFKFKDVIVPQLTGLVDTVFNKATSEFNETF